MLTRSVRRGRGGLKADWLALARPVDFAFRTLTDCRTKNAPEWFRGVGFALAVVVGAYGLRQLSDPATAFVLIVQLGARCYLEKRL